MEQIRYYKELSDELVQNRNQDYRVPADYVWIRDDSIRRLTAALCYGIAWGVGLIYSRLWLHVSIKNRNCIKPYQNTGCFLYANHTQPVGDVVLPAFASGGKRVYTIVSQANLGLPVIGKILPALGALPIPEDIPGWKAFRAAVERRILEKKCVVIYPEAHVWPYYTGIRPFPASSFRFPVECGAPVFVMTTTYQKRETGRTPKTTIYVDGPFWPDDSLKKKVRQQHLRDQVYACMTERSKNSTYDYIRYVKEGE